MSSQDKPTMGDEIHKLLRGGSTQPLGFAIPYKRAHNIIAALTEFYAEAIKAGDAEAQYHRERAEQEQRRGLPSQERERQEPLQAGHEQASGEEQARAGGAVQAPEQVGVEVPEHERQLAPLDPCVNCFRRIADLESAIRVFLNSVDEPLGVMRPKDAEDALRFHVGMKNAGDKSAWVRIHRLEMVERYNAELLAHVASLQKQLEDVKNF